jgi:hypothetical protein
VLILNDGYTFLRYDEAANTVTVTELSRVSTTLFAGPKRTTYELPDFLAAITPDLTDDD